MRQQRQKRIPVLIVCCGIMAGFAYKGYDMGILNRLFGKQDEVSKTKEEITNRLAFVLLSETKQPSAAAIMDAFQAFAAEGEVLEEVPNDTDHPESGNVVHLTLHTGEQLFVGLLPAPVPNGEAEQGVSFSLSRFRNGWELPSHSAHLVVSFRPTPENTPMDSLTRFTSVLAAVTKVSPAVGVYWGEAGATHDAEFFVTIASQQDVASRMMVWSGFSMAREQDGRISLLSLGMEQLELPNLLLVVGKETEGVAMETMYDLLAYVANLGEALPEGHTVGRSNDEQLPVHYVPSPIDPKLKVWRVEFP